jgi:hypothetical protein
MNIERAELDGDVAVEHTQLKLRSKALELAFEPQKKEATERRSDGATKGGIATQATTGAVAAAATKPSTRPTIRADLRQMVATGAVHCEIIDDKQRTQTIECNRLALLTAKTADGRLYPSTINADGEVKAVDPDQELRAGHLAIALKPTTRPTTRPSTQPAGVQLAQSATTRPSDTANAELQSLIAHKDVNVVTKEGARITADQLLVDNKGGQNVVKLLGQPARIVDEKNSLAGPIIELYSGTQRVEVFGAGAMKGVQQEKSGDVPRPVDVTWVRGLIVDGKANTVDVSGQVTAVSTDEKGAVNTAKGEHVRMLLADVAPTTKPAKPSAELIATTQASAKPDAPANGSTPVGPHPGPLPEGEGGKATTQPSRSSQYAGMSNKTIRKVTFTDSANAQISSVTMAADGSLLRRVHLEAPTVEHDMAAKKMIIPVAGRMIVEDHVAGKDKATEATQAKGAMGGGAAEAPRGSTAFQWSKSFTYDDATRLAVMTGLEDRPVIVAHRDDSEQARTFHLTGQVVTAEMEEVVVPSTRPATQPSGTTRPVEKKVQLRRVTASGRLTFAGPGVNVQAKELEFDPKSNVVTARGDGRSPVVFDIASSPGGQKVAESIQYDIKSGRLLNAVRVNVRMNR